MSGSTYGLTYYEEFFADFPRRALPVQRPPANTNTMDQIDGASLSQDWNHIRDSLRQEYNKIGNPHYLFVILNKFRQFHTKVEAKWHLWAWIEAVTRAYHDSTSAQNFIEANWAAPFKWVVGSSNVIEQHYWIGVDGVQTRRGRDFPEMLPRSEQLDQFYDNKWQIPSPQSWNASRDIIKKIKEPPYSPLPISIAKRAKKPTYSERQSRLPKILLASEAGQKKTIVQEPPDEQDTTMAEPVVPDWDPPEYTDISFAVERSPLTLLDLPSPIRAKILRMVLIKKKPIRPRRCDRAIGRDFKPIMKLDCPCRACCGTHVARWDIGDIKSTYAVAATCRTLREESIPIYYAHNKFQFYVGNQNTQALAMMLQSFFLIIGRQTARYIQHIIWADINDPHAFEEVLPMHMMQELSGVKTIRFVRMPTKTLQCRRVAPASQKEATPAFLAMKHYLDTRYLLRNNCANIDIIFPKFPVVDFFKPIPIHDIEECEQCKRHRTFFRDLEVWFRKMQ